MRSCRRPRTSTRRRRKLGFPASDIDLGLLTRRRHDRPRRSRRPPSGSRRTSCRSPSRASSRSRWCASPKSSRGKQRTFDEVKAEIKERLAERTRRPDAAGRCMTKAEAERAKGQAAQGDRRAAEAAVPRDRRDQPTGQDQRRQAGDRACRCGTHRRGRSSRPARRGDGGPGPGRRRLRLVRRGLGHAGAAEALRGGQGRGEDQLSSRAEKRKEIAALAAKQVERLKGGESWTASPRSWAPRWSGPTAIKRATRRRGCTPTPAVQQAFALAKGGAASAPTADGKSRIDPPRRRHHRRAARHGRADRPRSRPSWPSSSAIDVLEQYCRRPATRYGFTVNEKLLKQALGPQTRAAAGHLRTTGRQPTPRARAGRGP